CSIAPSFAPLSRFGPRSARCRLQESSRWTVQFRPSGNHEGAPIHSTQVEPACDVWSRRTYRRLTFARLSLERTASGASNRSKDDAPRRRFESGRSNGKKGRWCCATGQSAYVGTKRGGGQRVS